MDPRGPWGDFQMDEEVLRAGLLAVLVENRSESPRESSNKKIFVFSMRLPTEAGETAEGVPQLQWGSDHPGTLSAALGGPLSVLGGMALEAGFWFVPVHDYETRQCIMVRNGGEGADIGGRVMMEGGRSDAGVALQDSTEEFVEGGAAELETQREEVIAAVAAGESAANGRAPPGAGGQNRQVCGRDGNELVASV
uniref:Uncharacterized protein n=1 Tax=Chromera velia CCMP2878 TaxID=1169474 RepID=A0A0G4EYX0_9ALVE|eukprot:Cvel_14242.t1-p1 / transcript=Cvel_14242.t1 / gene=Cvel_14242 / organism=Chromera_velia_CCMP2878 / gene_product=hypothetical protein / transcript_product=hypothetical protein / location=Cvel_scaffold1005:25234-26768(+) / protein_length=194 / sequence_SO=supercontig / SO=protein_coding / is_pseudo=false